MIENIIQILSENGIGQGLLVVLVLGIMYLIYKRQESLQNQILAAKDEEIKRLVEDNKNLRNVFSALLKEKLNIRENEIETKVKEEELVLKQNVSNKK